MLTDKVSWIVILCNMRCEQMYCAQHSVLFQQKKKGFEDGV